MGIGNFFRELFSGDTEVDNSTIRYKTITNKDSYVYTVNGEIMRTALDTAIDYVAACIGKVEIQTYQNGKYVRGNDWYRWNVKPNLNQSSTDFWHEFVYKLFTAGKVLIVPVGEQLIIADDFSVENKALIPTIFTGIVKENYTINGIYNTTNCIYLNRNNSTNINKLISGLGSILDNILELACEKYYREGGEHGVLSVDTPPGLNDDEKAAYLQDLNDYFENFFKKKYAVAFLEEGMDYKSVTTASNTQKTSIISDIKEITKEAYSKIAQSVKVPPALLLGDTANITSNVVDNMIQYAVMPILDDFIEVANSIMYSPQEYLAGNYLKVDYASIKYLDAIDCAAGIDKLRADGMYNVNELRVKFGEKPIEQDFAEDYIITKNYSNVKESEKSELQNAE